MKLYDETDCLPHVKPDGGPAFPRENSDWGVPGMTLRDWFAGQALSGILANPHNLREVTFIDMANDSYRFADVMLVARADADLREAGE